MNLSIFNLPDPSGKLSKESYLIKNNNEEYNYIIQYCESNDIFDLPFKEKVYLCLNELKGVPVCNHPDCNKKVNFKNSSLGYLKYCSIKCISSDPDIKKIKEKKSMEKWGTKTPSESDIIKEKIISTNQLKYGGNSPMSSEEIQEKSKKTFIEKWGVDNVAKSEEIKKKRIESFKKNIDKYKESYKKTSIERYGVDHPWKNSIIHKKSVSSSKNTKSLSTCNIILNMIPDDYKMINFCGETGEATIICNSNHSFKSTRIFIYNRYRINSEICEICNPINNKKSGSEILLLKFINEIYDGNIDNNVRNIINPFEIDIYLPELKIGIEYNGLWWHSSEYREYDYHMIKQRKSNDSDIRLYTIWEDDWINRPDIVKSFLMNKLFKISNKIYARCCEIVEVSINDSDDFLDANHFNGVSSKSSIRISLQLNGEILSIITLKRNGSGWILDRFCNKNYARVVGSFSRMLNYFIKKYNPDFIITYSDNMMTYGDVYKKFGFENILDTNPTYSLLINKKRTHRLKDINSDSPKIWNAGMKKWIYTT